MKITFEDAMTAGRLAGNKRMRSGTRARAGVVRRTTWNRADYDHACWVMWELLGLNTPREKGRS